MENAFLPNHFYHVYNRANGKDNLFVRPQNYAYFLEKYQIQLQPVVETFAWCLLGNHFHLMIRIREEETLREFFNNSKVESGTDSQLHQPEHIVSKQFASFFSGYTQAFNKQNGRTGGLFQTPFKRKMVDSEDYCAQLLVYIHQNPEKHGFELNFDDYRYSSYSVYLSDRSRTPEMQEMFDWFGGRSEFIKTHQNCRLPQEFWLED